MSTPEGASSEQNNTPQIPEDTPKTGKKSKKAKGTPKAGKKPKAMASDNLKAEIDQTRAELAATIDELSARLAPGELAARAGNEVKKAASAAGEQAKQAVADAGGLLRGHSLPGDDADRIRNVKILAGAALVVGVFVGMAILRRRWR